MLRVADVPEQPPIIQLLASFRGICDARVEFYRSQNRCTVTCAMFALGDVPRRWWIVQRQVTTLSGVWADELRGKLVAFNRRKF